MHRRQVLALSTAAIGGSLLAAEDQQPRVLNDVQSQLNSTRVWEVIRPTTADELAATVKRAARTKRPISIAGGRHAMGGQQFGTDTCHLDTTSLNEVLHLDRERGQVTVQAGIQWPKLIEELHERQRDVAAPWTIREKQTGVDEVTLGGSLSANVHGRGLKYQPIVQDVESFELVDATGAVRQCSRRENPELFSLAIGGYGLFGIISQVTLRLVRRFKIERQVSIISMKDLPDRLNDRIASGCVFGDCQYSVALEGAAAEHPGVFPCYRPVSLQTAVTEAPRKLAKEEWARLYKLLRSDKQRAFEEYAAHYRQTDGQVYWSDTHQLAGDFVGHRSAVDAQEGTEMITEVYVSHENFLPFLARVREELKARDADLTYGTIRYIEADGDTFLPWAHQRSVCIVCNLHVRHTESGIAKAKADFQAILDRVIEFGGSFYLTYHRWATPEHIAACYPRIREFFGLKRKYDAAEIFQSDWYRHYAPAFI